MAKDIWEVLLYEYGFDVMVRRDVRVSSLRAVCGKERECWRCSGFYRTFHARHTNAALVCDERAPD